MSKIAVGIFCDGTEPAILVRTFPGDPNKGLTDKQELECSREENLK